MNPNEVNPNPCHHTEGEIKTRAYYLKMENYGKTDEDRYYIAEKITERLCNEECLELPFDSDKHICMFCDCRYATIKTPYLPFHICWSCFWHHSEEQLTKLYESTSCNMELINRGI